MFDFLNVVYTCAFAVTPRFRARFSLVPVLSRASRSRRHLALKTKPVLRPVGQRHVRGAGEAADDGEGLGGGGATDLGFFPKWSPSQDDPGRKVVKGPNHTFGICSSQSGK